MKKLKHVIEGHLHDGEVDSFKCAQIATKLLYEKFSTPNPKVTLFLPLNFDSSSLAGPPTPLRVSEMASNAISDLMKGSDVIEQRCFHS